MTVMALRKVVLIAGLFSTALWADTLVSPTVTDNDNSANAARLIDGATGPLPENSWSNSANPWSADSYPMTAVIDLGVEAQLDGLRLFAGQIPAPATASVAFDYALDVENFSPLMQISSPGYNRWTPTSSIDSIRARYVRVRFDTLDSRFNLAEIEIDATPVTTAPPPTPPTPTPPTPPAPEPAGR